jgi:hypothetical protein
MVNAFRMDSERKHVSEHGLLELKKAFPFSILSEILTEFRRPECHFRKSLALKLYRYHAVMNRAEQYKPRSMSSGSTLKPCNIKRFCAEMT